ncbi:hypothetical protein QBC36DRAFT_92115 [Triangularia setosa]|uniref:Uncharacterized protein n=1 Tax=Triangularia setosa TaxID=2587417 RepID=A0AAN6WD46_9PEZI|nr:hypothetical protein QBC36DRAFT_92115 [Podospora setosa]
MCHTTMHCRTGDHSKKANGSCSVSVPQGGLLFHRTIDTSTILVCCDTSLFSTISLPNPGSGGGLQFGVPEGLLAMMQDLFTGPSPVTLASAARLFAWLGYPIHHCQDCRPRGIRNVAIPSISPSIVLPVSPSPPAITNLHLNSEVLLGLGSGILGSSSHFPQNPSQTPFLQSIHGPILITAKLKRVKMPAQCWRILPFRHSPGTIIR